MDDLCIIVKDSEMVNRLFDFDSLEKIGMSAPKKVTHFVSDNIKEVSISCHLDYAREIKSNLVVIYESDLAVQNGYTAGVAEHYKSKQ